MDKFMYSSKTLYLVASLALSLVMAGAWGGVFWVLDTGHGPVVALIVFLVMFGLLARGEGDADA
jgi:hypothetical protein